ncbi:MAG: phage tail protein [Alphaproteobacteria bacterium]|nr:phage tail protein [Alphaproteobacteria bacterium]
MADWIGRGGGRKEAQPSISSLSDYIGHGQGRNAAQAAISALSDYTGHGQGRKAAQPSISTLSDYTGHGQGRKAAQPSISTRGSWVGSGKGRAGGQPGISAHAEGRSGPESAILDPEGNFYFALEIDGIEIAQFNECSGIKSTTEVFEIEEGGVNHRVHKLPGQSRWENITLRYGVTNDTSMLGWRNEVLSDSFRERRSGAIIVKNNAGEEVRRYSFTNAWPVAWEGPSFSASGAEVAVEMMELAHEGVSVS